MMGDLSLLFAVSLYFFHSKYWARNRRAALSVLAMAGATLVLTRSGTGAMLALVVGLVAILSARFSFTVKVFLLSAVLAMISILAGLTALSPSRGAVVLAAVVADPALAVRDESFASRFTGVFVGLYAIRQSPFGSASARQDVGLTNSAMNSTVAQNVWPSATLRGLLVDTIASRDNISGIGGMIQRMGIFAIVITVALLYFIRGFHGKWVVRFYTIGLLLNASMFISTLWFIVACCVRLQSEPASAAEGA
jgi:hypothetical protein